MAWAAAMARSDAAVAVWGEGGGAAMALVTRTFSLPSPLQTEDEDAAPVPPPRSVAAAPVSAVAIHWANTSAGVIGWGWLPGARPGPGCPGRSAAPARTSSVSIANAPAMTSSTGKMPAARARSNATTATSRVYSASAVAMRFISAPSWVSSDVMLSSSGSIRSSENWCNRVEDSSDQDATSRNSSMPVPTSTMASMRCCKRLLKNSQWHFANRFMRRLSSSWHPLDREPRLDVEQMGPCETGVPILFPHGNGRVVVAEGRCSDRGSGVADAGVGSVHSRISGQCQSSLGNAPFADVLRSPRTTGHISGPSDLAGTCNVPRIQALRDEVLDSDLVVLGQWLVAGQHVLVDVFVVPEQCPT
eukprot:9559308-Heterocapsa_arctica.AAC.1